MKSVLLFFLVAGVVAAQSAPTTRKNIPAIAKAANGAIVSIIMSDNDRHEIAKGTGFLISKDGRIVTNYHVIENGSSAIVKLPSGAFFVVDGVLAIDKARDVAIIKAHGDNFRTLTLGNSDRLQIGEEVVAIGNPLSLESTVSNGILSGIRTVGEEGGKFLQVTAPISPGSSGGPLFNMAGEVVGITTLYSPGGENLNFAIPINDAKRLLLAKEPKIRDLPNEAEQVNVQTHDVNLPSSSIHGGYSTEPFDTAVASLPPKFAGNDPEAIYKALFAIQQKALKTEFESTSEYQQRLRQAPANTALIGRLELGSWYSFRLDPNEIRSQYDADTHQLAITLQVTDSHEIHERTRRLALKRIVTGDRHSKASNAFGVTVDVTSLDVEMYGATLMGLQVPNGYGETTLKISLSPQRAMKIKPNLAGLIVMKLHQPPDYTAIEDHYSGATLDLPYALSTKWRDILGQTVDLWFFDEQDGEVFYKLSESSAMAIARNEVSKQAALVSEKQRKVIDVMDALIRSNPSGARKFVPSQDCQFISSLYPEIIALTDLVNNSPFGTLPVPLAQQVIANNNELLHRNEQMKAMNFSCPGMEF
jgi:Trypsin-like peptidase domain